MVREKPTTGPQIWCDLNTKAHSKIQAYLDKNEERTAWLDIYFEDCKKKLGAVTAEPSFVPKTPVASKRTRRGRPSKDAGEEQVADVAPVVASKKNSRKKSSLAQSQIIAQKDNVVTAEPVNATLSVSGEASTIEASMEPVEKSVANATEPVEKSVANATFDVGQHPVDPPTFIVDSSVVSGLSTNTTESFAFIEAEIIVQEQEFVEDTNGKSLTESASNVDKPVESEPSAPSPHPVPTPRKNKEEVLPSPVPAPRNIDRAEEEDHETDHNTNTDSTSPIVTTNSSDESDSRKSVDKSVEKHPKRSTRTKRGMPTDDETEQEDAETIKPVITTNTDDKGESNKEEDKRRTRTKNIRDILTSVSSEENVDESETNKRSTRTRTKKADVSSSSEAEDARPTRSTRTKKKMLPSQSEKNLTGKVASLASPRVKELVNKAMSPATRNSSPSKVPIYVGSPIKDRVKVFEEAMRDSAGLKKTSRRKSSSVNTESLRRVSAAKGVQVTEVLADQEVNIVSKGAVIRKSPGTGRTSLNNSRAPAGKVVKPGRKVLASGGRGITTPGSGSHTGSSSSRRGITTPGSGSHNGSSSSNMIKSRSRLNLGSKGLNSTPSNMVSKKGGVSSFLPGKPKAPTLAEVQAQKDEERKRKEEKEVEAKQRRDELLKSKADEQREKREARVKRVQEARQKQETNDDKLRRNQEKDKEEKLALLKKREEKLKEDAEKRKKETEVKLKEAEERRKREDDERLAKHEKQEKEKKNNEKKREEEAIQRKQREEDERKKKSEEEKRKKAEDLKRDEEIRHRREQEIRKEDQKRKMEEEKKRLVAHQERIQREKEELSKMKAREALRQGDLNSTYSKDKENSVNKTQILDSTASKAIQGVTSYDMTPARHELPPEPLQNEDDYGLEDLKSDQDTDDEDAPRKQIPKWAEGTHLRTTLLKQCYMGPNVDDIFMTIIMPDLSEIFEQQRKRFFKRTSSACWDQAPTSFKVSKQ